jgi:phenylacetic acid degradation protein
MSFYSIDGVTPVIDRTSYVHPSAVVIGDVIIGKHCYIGPLASLRGDFGPIVIEDGVNIQDNCILHSFPDVTVYLEKFAHIGHGATLHGCIIRQGAMIGIGATIMDKAEVGQQSFVGAHSFVKTADKLPAQSMIFGTPARVVRPLTEEEMEWKHRGTEAYMDLARRSLESCVTVKPDNTVSPDRKTLLIKNAVRPKQDEVPVTF